MVTSQYRSRGSRDTDTDTDTRSSIDTALRDADALMEVGRWREAIDVLNAANRQGRDRELERALLRIRHDAFEQIDRGSSAQWPPIASAQGLSGCPPEVSPEDLDLTVFTNGIVGSGSLLVRGLIPPATVGRLVEGIDRAFAAYDSAERGSLTDDDAPWFDEFQPAPHQRKWSPDVRKFVRSGGGVFAADSPRVFFDLLEAVEQAGIPSLVRAYFGEEPALSVKKTTLRRVTTDRSDASWHQDGAFMGTNIRTVNLWLALTKCGDDAPGLDILPRRLGYIVETGTPGAMFEWAASSAKVVEAGEGIEVCRPSFEAGDALLFDHFFMHRTAVDSTMTKDRHGVEMWFFAPSLYPLKEIPLMV
jgi:hypothetical protein